MSIVLDTWAVLGYLQDEEPAASLVERVLDERPVMSWINLGEVYYILIRRHGESAAEETVRDLRSVLNVELPREHVVQRAAQIKAGYSMSYADAFAAATALGHHAELWTGDPELLVPNAPWLAMDLRATQR
ncbi:PIN domain-containing protein [Pseudonocardia acaciae]|uniref:PIN domain-containing protein n=1 Tax=Pseudonocardia acaciae TaxID=551276 RepID=UPI00048B70A0|nr:PIN domain-containing protein [Pseudonocardia acaciae]